MKTSEWVSCGTFPCIDVRRECYVVPDVDIDPTRVSIILVSEAPSQPSDYYYAGDEALFAQTTLEAFRQAGAAVATIPDIVDLGVYLTTAVKCGKTGYNVASGTVKECARLLDAEIALFPNARVILAMGDVAIKAVNAVAARWGYPRPVPPGPTYKIRGGEFCLAHLRVLPSYLQAGPSFFIEKGKRRVIVEDIATALRLAAGQ